MKFCKFQNLNSLFREIQSVFPSGMIIGGPHLRKCPTFRKQVSSGYAKGDVQ